jgi:uncharacterized membrane protein YkoI
MQRKTIWIIVGVLSLALVGGGAGVAAARLGDDDTPITGAELDDASAAALEEVGGGEVTDAEVGDDEGAYEVEVTRDDGTEVDVHLAEDFSVVGIEDEADDPDADEED